MSFLGKKSAYTMNIKVINKSKHALPSYETLGAAGMDIRANIDEPLLIESLDRIAIPTGLYIQLPSGFEAQIRPRSGMTLKTGMSVLNSPGTIDCDYRGEIKIIVANLSKEPIRIQDGDRIAQMVIARYERLEWVEVDSLDESSRGEGGFGSTGKN